MKKCISYLLLISACTFAGGMEVPSPELFTEHLPNSTPKKLTIDSNAMREHTIEDITEQVSGLFHKHFITRVNIAGKYHEKLFLILRQLSNYQLNDFYYRVKKISPEVALALASLQTTSLVIHSKFENPEALHTFTSELGRNHYITNLKIYISQDELLEPLCAALGTYCLFNLALLSTKDDFRPQLSWNACVDLSNITQLQAFTTNMSIAPYFAREPATQLQSYSDGLLRYGISISFMPNVTSFDFSGANFGTEDATTLIHTFKTERHNIHSLTLDSNDIQLSYMSTYTPLFIQALSSMICNNECQLSLSLANNVLGNGIALILKYPQLTSVNLSNTYMNNTGAAIIARYIKDNRSLQDLDISYNQFSSDGIIMMSEAISMNQTLQSLNMEGIPMDICSLCAIFEALKLNKSIRYVNLGYTGINRKTAGLPFDLIDSRSDDHPLKISLRGNLIGEFTLAMYGKYIEDKHAPISITVSDDPYNALPPYIR